MLTRDFRLLKPTREWREMAVLGEIGRSSSTSQRGLARAAGVSPAMVNAYVDDLLSRGLVDVTGETNRTYRYFLTPSGRELHDALHQQLSKEVFELYARLRQELRIGEAPVASLAEAQSA